ncbi:MULTISPECIES: hypothetical protein [unclassified Bradyrhizobium]|uniref:hypothetical protein n=1 Tax=unclassified Bradyrhizobium TaxID=2631580 RepID=UPI00247998BF|nr:MULTISPECIES: hypothetical protein [unclassified Bradyrhizobium]WGR67817.1 hypothetical protein MTX24_20325 [Bradyrhizobium sp. ISRA426]WGR79870.1 hypothetical protein MTX21_05440 [Bradyrhizobium sp. ISRA430]WGR83056.1 hypothetical protein MTX25_20005 [Bradyrhizobium sp. ISRA432]
MRRIGLVAILLVFAFGAYLWVQPAYTQRFRLTIEIQTPEGIKSGSSVIETHRWESGNWGPIEAGGIRSDFKGRAVFVDLGHGKNVVALLGFGPFGADQYRLFRLTRDALAPGQKADWTEDFKLKGRGVLPPDDVPALATFKDVSDPTSALRVDPADAAATLGPGFAFRQARLETTSEAASTGIEKMLPWWRLPGHPAVLAYRAWRQGSIVGPTLEPEHLFQRE